MIKRYYIEETNGKETKRTLTTFNGLDDMRNYSDNEIQEMYYEATAEVISKARKVDMLLDELIGRYNEGESDFDMKIINQASDNRNLAVNILL